MSKGISAVYEGRKSGLEEKWSLFCFDIVGETFITVINNYPGPSNPQYEAAVLRGQERLHLNKKTMQYYE